MKKDLSELGDEVDDAVNELLVIWPRFGDALERDAGTNQDERVTTSANVTVLPLNVDVLNAIRVLQAETWPTVWEVRSVLREPGAILGIEKSIATVAILYRRLVGRGYDGEARKLAATVLRWHHIARTAIGLSRRPIPLAGDDGIVTCPLHDQPLTQLRVRGDEGTLDETAHGDREAITWRSGSGLYCPYRDCDGAWGPSEYPFLGRLVSEQRLRLTRQETA